KELPKIHSALDEFVARDEAIVVANVGLHELLRLGERRAVAFEGSDPERSHGDDIVAALEQTAREGAAVLVVPSISLWWNEELQAQQPAIRARFREIASTEACTIFDLRRKPATFDAVTARGNGVAAFEERPDEGSDDLKLIAFYLPQFHPIPENDAWWGEGFTEWRNVTKSTPLFGGHHQPHLPADLGFYDLRLSETREAQANLARDHGITGFCYYHYWFSGKQLLERPFEEVLLSGQPDFPFCLCWANEPWSRRWDGVEDDVLQPQSYSEEDDRRHIAWLLPALLDRRAIRVDGKPLLLIYQGRELPDPTRTIEIWQSAARDAGLTGLHLVSVETGWDAGWDATRVGFDAKVLFQPQFSILDTVPKLDLGPEATRVFDYQEAWPILAEPDPVDYPRYDCVCPSWDNTARRGQESWVIHNSTPEAYQEWLELAIRRTLDRPQSEQLVFVNAWNEWAEGAHLEPDQRWGLSYLEATRRAVERTSVAHHFELKGVHA
ncbi:MAG TPA: glycoside hydrolase family 99-like domain-containing protein, partial [Thermoanaerobaculia bacterium]